MTPARLFIIDDHDAVREALQARLSDADGLEVVGCTGRWETGLQEAARLEPDVVLLETKRADGKGLEALRSLVEQCPHTNVIVLTSYLDAEEQREARRMGAERYILKDIDTSQLAHEVQATVRPQPTSSGHEGL